MSDDPYATLGLTASADDEAIRRAYLQKVKDHPPERDAAAFERVRDAYDALRDPRRRARRAALDVDPLASLLDLVSGWPGARPFVGPAPWLALLARDGA